MSFAFARFAKDPVSRLGFACETPICELMFNGLIIEWQNQLTGSDGEYVMMTIVTFAGFMTPMVTTKQWNNATSGFRVKKSSNLGRNSTMVPSQNRTIS